MSRRKKRERERWKLQDEPWPEADDLMEFGGEVYMPMGFTSGGAPYGPTLTELREHALQDDRERGWARAYRAMMTGARQLGLPEPALGQVRKIGQGSARDAFGAEVHPGTEDWPRMLVALVPRHGAGAAQAPDRVAVERAARLLTFLEQRDLAFRVPRLAVAAFDGVETVLVSEFLEGVPVDLRAGRMTSVRPWQLVGGVAAAVHFIPTEELDWLAGYPTRRKHGEALLDELMELEGSADETVCKALAWLFSHLPTDAASTLLHGDLSGQNLRLLPREPLRVLDWEHALRGDPASDLAHITRGERRPFQLARGMERLLEAYNSQNGASPLRESEVRFHEIVLHLQEYRQARSDRPIDIVLARLRKLLERD